MTLPTSDDANRGRRSSTASSTCSRRRSQSPTPSTSGKRSHKLHNAFLLFFNPRAAAAAELQSKPEANAILKGDVDLYYDVFYKHPYVTVRKAALRCWRDLYESMVKSPLEKEKERFEAFCDACLRGDLDAMSKYASSPVRQTQTAAAEGQDSTITVAGDPYPDTSRSSSVTLDELAELGFNPARLKTYSQ